MRDQNKDQAELLATCAQLQTHELVAGSAAQGGSRTLHLEPPLAVAPMLLDDDERAQDAHPTILLIEDEAIVRRTTSALLATGGFDVVEAADGEEGLAVYDRERSRIDLVLLDWSMPRLSGEAVLAELVKRSPNVRVVLFSGQQPPAKLQPNVRAIIQKPSPVDSVLSTLRAALEA
jgi:CheY-like chemotaxis protein